MSSRQEMPNVERVLSGLKDFQQQTVDYVFRRLYTDPDPVKRFLVADEVGLGKTLVARGVIAKAIEHLWKDVDRIDVVYICANRDIAKQNVNRLNVTGQRETSLATRMTMLPMHLHNLHGNKINFVSFTPNTSFNLRSSGGIWYERALIYHILHGAWRFGEASGPRKVLQCSVGTGQWRKLLRNFPTPEIDPHLASLYVKALEQTDLRQRFRPLAKRFGRFRRYVPTEYAQLAGELAGELRVVLARTCVQALEPDLVILDEFQRFKTLLDGEDEVACLAKEVFEHPDAKVLLLLATPYKMYTMYHEQGTDDHYADFLRTVGFLFGAPQKTAKFKEDLDRYRRALLASGEANGQELVQAKHVIEVKLRKVMVRTERLSATADRGGMIQEVRPTAGRLEAQDLRAFARLDHVAGVLDAGDTVEYWKSAPYILNVMDRNGYHVKRKLVEMASGDCPALADAVNKASEALLPWRDIRAYRKVDPANAKLRALLADKVDNGAWKLLWVPASLPYYRLADGPYAEAGTQDFTKALVFSSWLVVPKVIAMLASYEAERRMVEGLDSHAGYQEERRQRRPLLRFSFSEGRATGMSVFPLIFPCLTLAERVDPMEIACALVTEAADGELPTFEKVREVARRRVEELLEPVLRQYPHETSGPIDERWYWAALALLDRMHFGKPLKKWLESQDEKTSWREMVRTADDGDSNFGSHVAMFSKFVYEVESLGRPPADLLNVLTGVAMASPAVSAARAMRRLFHDAKASVLAEHLYPAAARAAMGFRTLFNLPESMTLLRGLSPGEDSRYWQTVLDYCAAGNLQAVLDEYTHILRESLGLIDVPPDAAIRDVAAEIHEAVSIRTASLEFDELKANAAAGTVTLDAKKMRCRFALRFGDARNEEEGLETRADQVRSAFNSPFRPFVLATTSIGQEGLDFHQYCHEIYHWNLPSNPVDLEQREGRIHRYKGHVIRRNVARAYPLAALAGQAGRRDPWKVLFDLARRDRAAGMDDLVPFWIFEPEGGLKVRRHIPALPLSRDHEHLAGLRRSLVAYRMVLGQPRQEDLLRFLESRLTGPLTPEDLLKYRIDLSPPAITP